MPVSTMSAKKLYVLSALLACVSVASFFIGLTALALGIPALKRHGASLPSAPSLFGGGDQPAKAGFRGGRPVGLYFMTRYWIATGSLEKSVWYFTPDGEAYENLRTGFSKADLEAHEGRRGKVSMDGDAMVITWPDGKETKSRLEVDKDGEGFAWDTGLFTPVEAFDDDGQLAGKWEGGESLSRGGNFIAASRSLDIRTDGSFDRSSIASVKGTTEHSEIGAGSQSAGTGQWKLDGYTLTLTEADGKVTKGICFPFDDEATPVKPDRFFFNGTMYKKQG